MTKVTLYRIVVLILLLINIGLLSTFLVMKRPPLHHPKGPEEVVEILSLDNNQEKEFMLLAKQHRSEMMRIESLQNQLLINYFKNSDQNGDSGMSEAISEFKTLAGEKLTVTYEHFNEVYNILEQHQKERFPKFIDHVLGGLKRGPKKNPPPPKDF